MMWKLFNKHKRNEEQAAEPVSPLICPNGQYTMNDEEKLAEFARHMHSVHQTPDDQRFDVDFKQEVDKTIREMDVSKSDIASVDPLQVKDFRLAFWNKEQIRCWEGWNHLYYIKELHRQYNWESL